MLSQLNARSCARVQSEGPHAAVDGVKVEIDRLLSAAYKNPSKNYSVFAVDVGGTKISYGLFPVDSQGEIQRHALYQNTVDAVRGPVPIAKALQHCFRDAVNWASQQGVDVLPAVSVGTPGRFVGPNQEIIAPKSAANLEAVPGELDNFAWVPYLASWFPDYVKMRVKNDALSQMSAGLNHLLQCESYRGCLLGQKVAYIGPGTGLGGGFCTVDDKGCVEFFSDGHIIDNPIKDKEGHIHGAEDLFSGRAFEALTGKTAKAVNSDSALFARHMGDIKRMGHYLAQIIQGIYLGDLEKTDPAARWPQADIDKARGTRVFLIGGSMGTQGKMGHLIQETARETLRDMGLGSIIILSIADAQDIALLGTAQFLTKTQLLGAIDYVSAVS